MNKEHAYYRAAMLALKFIDDRGARRRFGPDADARWDLFAGEPAALTMRDRIDLELRDADAQWPGAFAARVVFNLYGVAGDDAFGGDWSGEAQPDLWAETAACTPTLPELLDTILAVWGQSREPCEIKLILQSPSEVVAAVLACVEQNYLFWSRDVVIVADADSPRGLCTRQLGALAGAILRQPSRLRLPNDSAP